MKFQWPRTPDEVKQISFQQVEWLLQGLKIEQEKARHPVKRSLENSCFRLRKVGKRPKRWRSTGHQQTFWDVLRIMNTEEINKIM